MLRCIELPVLLGATLEKPVTEPGYYGRSPERYLILHLATGTFTSMDLVQADEFRNNETNFIRKLRVTIVLDHTHIGRDCHMLECEDAPLDTARQDGWLREHLHSIPAVCKIQEQPRDGESDETSTAQSYAVINAAKLSGCCARGRKTCARPGQRSRGCQPFPDTGWSSEAAEA